MTARAPSPRSSAPSPSRGCPPGGGGHGRTASRGVLGEAPHDEPGEGRRSAARWPPRCGRGRRARFDDLFEHRRLVAQQLGGAHDVALGRRVQPAQRGYEVRASAVAGVGGIAFGGVLAPGQAARRAVRRGLLAGDTQQRAHQQAVALGHPEQRATPGRGGQAVQHGLGLIGRRVARGHLRAARERRARARAEAHVARPGLQVAGVRRPLRRLELELDAEARAERAAELLVAARASRSP